MIHHRPRLRPLILTEALRVPQDRPAAAEAGFGPVLFIRSGRLRALAAGQTVTGQGVTGQGMTGRAAQPDAGPQPVAQTAAPSQAQTGAPSAGPGQDWRSRLDDDIFLFRN